MIEIIEKVMNFTTAIVSLVTAVISLKVITSSKKGDDEDD